MAAWTGEECETDLDYCETNPCLASQVCTDIVAEVQGNNETGYDCGSCPEGYESNTVDNECSDVDECENATCGANSVCHNTEGSFFCECNDGYRLDVDNNTQCLDINECLERLSGCEQGCDNTEGSFTCLCGNAYDLNADGKNCDTKSGLPAGCSTCDQVCVVNGTEFSCSCRVGYRVDPLNDTKCINIDECQEGVSPCSQLCEDSDGSFVCSCYPGFQLDREGQGCDACEIPFYGANCTSKCLCNGQGTCDNVRGCVCDAEWHGENCNVDVDECEDPKQCPVGETCENTEGGFSCNCGTGFERLDGTCVDINECAEIEDHTCDLSVENCVNTPGTYGCACRRGFTRGSSGECEDIDECALGSHTCQSICENVFGLYNCKCPYGFRLMADRVSCEEVSNMCQQYTNLTCQHTCAIDRQAETATCSCYQGYSLDGETNCQDINECSFDHLNLCEDKTTCVNTDGSYKCACPVGSKLENDKRSCTACSGGTWGDDCANNCSCGINAIECDIQIGCLCKAGFKGENCEEDVDECALGTKTCPTAQICVNTPGSAECGCVDGFSVSGDDCVDIDECSDGTHDCGQLCSNYPGGYWCGCYEGYSKDSNGTCADIDECSLGLNKCTQICINTDGNYRCDCDKGYSLDGDGSSCSYIEECKPPVACTSLCARVDGANFCSCPPGQALNNDNVTCDDIDLCALPNPCEELCNENADNTSVVCSCLVGSKLDTNGYNCTECLEGRFGVECFGTCNCSVATTISCDKLTGSCNCKSGFEGAACEDDINECVSTPCQLSAECINTPGNYTCLCNAGYSMDDFNSCQECVDGFYGVDCVGRCDCNAAQSTCNKTDGVCICSDGWEGTRCDTDIDECVSLNNCSATGRTNWECKNTPGSYVCECENGYSDNGTHCEDFDECAASFSNQCDHSCNNTKGSYVCSCNSGFVLNATSGTNCLDIDECASSNGGCQSVCNNEDGSFSCSCSAGYTLLSDSVSCQQSEEHSTRLTFQVDTSNITFDPLHSSYITVKTNLRLTLLTALQALDFRIIDIIIVTLSKGSLVVDATGVLDISSGGDVTGAYIQALVDLSNTNITVNGYPTQPTILLDGTIVNNTTDECALLESISPCDSGETCTLINSIATCNGGSSGGDDVGLIVGLSVGLPLLVVVAVLLVALMYYKTKNQALVRVASREGHYQEDVSKRPLSGKSATGLLSFDKGLDF